MTSQPWMKFYPTDWRSDPALRMCSIGARGLWMEMLALMHEASPRGDLVVKGTPVTPEYLAVLAGIDVETTKELMGELENMEVFSRRRNGVIFSRRMEKDEQKARKNRDNGKLGGNPSLCKTTKKTKSVKGQDKAQKPEARSQKPERVERATPDDTEKKEFINGLTKGLFKHGLTKEQAKERWLSKIAQFTAKHNGGDFERAYGLIDAFQRNEQWAVDEVNRLDAKMRKQAA